jgi:hypothetical protein
MLFDELNRLKTDSIILPRSPDIPFLPDSDIDEADNLWDIPDIAPFPTTEEPAEAVPPSILRPAWRNLAPEFGSGAVTRARARKTTVTFAEDHRKDDPAATAYLEKEDVSELLVMNALLQSDPQEGVPKNYEELMMTN